jgi:replicative DNA helicase
MFDEPIVVDDGYAPVDRQIAQLRVPPHSIEAESSVLGGLLLDNHAWDRVGDLLVESDFYRHEHQLIYTAIAALVNASKPADVITVYERLQSLGKSEEIGGLVYLNALAQYVPSASNIRRYAEIVRERAILRKLVTASDEIATNAFNPQGKPVDRILDEAEQKIFNIGEEGSRMKQGFQAMDTLVVNLLDRVQEMAENPNDITGVPTGFIDLDRMTSGLQAGDMVVLAARPSMGKTAFAVNIAEHVALNEGLPVAIFSMEMGAAQLAVRIVGSIGRINQGNLRTGKLTDDEWPRLTEAIERLRNVSLHIDETPGLTPSELRANARRLARSCGKLGLIVGGLPAAHERLQRLAGREPRHRAGRNLARPQDAGQGAAVPGDCALAAQPLGGAAHRQAPHDVRPARIRRHRAGCGHHHVHLPRRLLQQGLQGAERGRGHHRQAT